MTRLRITLLPHVFLSGHRPAPPRPAYVTARDLRAAIAANAALMSFAGTEAPVAAPPGDAEFALGAGPASSGAAAGATPDAAAASSAADAAAAQPPSSDRAA